MSVIAYTYEADTHCVSCATERFRTDGGPTDPVTGSYISPAATDAEGNPVHPVFGTDENPDGLICGTCGTVISEPWWLTEDTEATTDWRTFGDGEEGPDAFVLVLS